MNGLNGVVLSLILEMFLPKKSEITHCWFRCDPNVRNNSGIVPNSFVYPRFTFSCEIVREIIVEKLNCSMSSWSFLVFLGVNVCIRAKVRRLKSICVMRFSYFCIVVLQIWQGIWVKTCAYWGVLRFCNLWLWRAAPEIMEMLGDNPFSMLSRSLIRASYSIGNAWLRVSFE